jgi:predicted metal-binding protein
MRCPLCNEITPVSGMTRQHLRKKHNIQTIEEIREFSEKYKMRVDYLHFKKSNQKEIEINNYMYDKSHSTVTKEKTREPYKIEKIDIETGKIIKIYDSIGEAAAENCTTYECIRKAVRGTRKTAVGYKWRKVS